MIYLDVKPEDQQQRVNWGDERFERAEIQRKVAQNFQQLFETGSWTSVNAGDEKEKVHEKVLEAVLKTVESCREQPVRKLYHELL